MQAFHQEPTLSDMERMRQRKIGWIVFGSIVMAVGLLLVARSYLFSPAETPSTERGAQSGTDLLLAPATSVPASPTPLPSASPTPAPVVVYISGAVARPDVYELPPDARVKDVVLAAGGLTAEADSERINLAAHIHDAQHIHVPRQNETLPPDDERVPQGEPPDAAGAAGAASGDDMINLNTASVSDLAALRGIGEVTAQRIVDYRTVNGPFATIDELQNVRGIGPTLLADLQGSIYVGES
jgi:competence protein ComEA